MIKSKLSWTAVLGAFLAGCGGGGAGLAGYYYPAKAVDFEVRFEPGEAAFHDIVLQAKNPHNAALTYAIVTFPTIVTPLGEDPGTLSNHLDGDEDVRYVPGTAPTGAYVAYFTFTVDDGTTLSNEATVTIYLNTKPVANDVSVVVDMDSTDNPITLVGTDGDGHSLTYQIVTQPANGTIGSDDGDNSVTYTPNAGYTGPDSFTYTVNDGIEDSDSATVTIKVNAPPNAQDQTVVTALDTPVTITLVATDPDGDPLTYYLGPTNPTQGTLGAINVDQVTYTPSGSGVYVDDTFGFYAEDDSFAASPEATVRVVVTSVWAWGDDEFGALGDNAPGDADPYDAGPPPTGTLLDNFTSTPAQVVGVGAAGNLTGAVGVGAGRWWSLAVMYDGTVMAWGQNDVGQLGDDTKIHSATPVQVVGPGAVGVLDDIVAVDGGERHSAALKSDGTVWCWGQGDGCGELGRGGPPLGPPLADSRTPVQVATNSEGTTFLTDVDAIAVGKKYTLALKSDGTVWAWGKNNCGQLGDGAPPIPPDPPDSYWAIQVPGLTDVIAIAAKEATSVALKSDGSVWAWGQDDERAVGDGDGDQSVNRHSPVQVVAGASPGSTYLENIELIASGNNFSLAADDTGAIWAWGSDGSGCYGDLGIGGSQDNPQPGGDGITTSVAIRTGEFHVLDLLADGSLWVWGRNGNYQLGDTTQNDSGTPTQRMTNILPPQSPHGTTAVGGRYHSLAIKIGQ